MRQFEYEVSPMVDGRPTVTLGDVERAISDVSYHRLTTSSGALTTVTTCLIVLDNGYTVTGESACVVPEKFNAELGNKFAYERAMNEVWKLLGYELRLKLNGESV
jgi:hypothetical protein